MAANILSVQGITKLFGNLYALDNVSLDVVGQKVSILIGPNGSGKTTLINIISGLYKPDSGKVLFEGEDVTGYPPFKLYRLGMGRTFQIPALFWKLTVLENLLVAEKKNPGESFFRPLQIVGFQSWRDFFAPWTSLSSIVRKLLRERSVRSFFKSLLPAFANSWSTFFTPTWAESEKRTIEKASRILELLGLSSLWDQPSHVLSGGQMKLVEIGRALMSDAKLLLLDEPVSGVNPTLAHEIFSRILKLRDELGLTFFIVEHRLDIALKYVDEMFVMALGKVIASGPPVEVMNNKKVIEAYLGG